MNRRVDPPVTPLQRLTQWRRAEIVYAAIGVVVASLIAVFAALAGYSSRVELLVGTSVAGALVLLAVQRLFDSSAVTAWARRTGPDDDAYVAEDRVTFLERRLEICTKDERVFETRIQPVVHDLTAHALRRHHGIDADRQPDLARRVAGDRLWELATVPSDHPITAGELVEAIDRIEELSSS